VLSAGDQILHLPAFLGVLHQCGIPPGRVTRGHSHHCNGEWIFWSKALLKMSIPLTSDRVHRRRWYMAWGLM